MEPRINVEDVPGEVRDYAAWCHLSALIFLLCIPFGNVLGPLVLWSRRCGWHAFLDAEAKNALNFQMSMTLYALVALPLVFGFLPVGIPLLFIIVVADVVSVMMAALAVNSGQSYEYPASIRFVG